MTPLFDLGALGWLLGSAQYGTFWLTVVDSCVWFGGAYVFVVLLP